MYDNITTNQLADLLKEGSINLIDVGEVYEHQFGHIKEAINIPVNQLAMDYNNQLDQIKLTILFVNQVVEVVQYANI